MPLVGVARFERFFRRTTELDVHKRSQEVQRLREPHDFVNRKLCDLFLIGQATATGNGAERRAARRRGNPVRLLRIGFIKIDRKSFLRPDAYAAADEIDHVQDGRVHLLVHDKPAEQSSLTTSGRNRAWWRHCPGTGGWSCCAASPLSCSECWPWCGRGRRCSRWCCCSGRMRSSTAYSRWPRRWAATATAPAPAAAAG